MGQSLPLFCLFTSLPHDKIQIGNNIDGVLGTQTRGSMMEGADISNELWWPPMYFYYSIPYCHCKKISIYLIFNSLPRQGRQPVDPRAIQSTLEATFAE